MSFNNFVDNYVDDLKSALDSLDKHNLNLMAHEIKVKILNKNKIFLMGNGGSSAAPSHSAGDFSKELNARVICLSDNIPALTAWSNDTSYDNCFRGQLETFLDKEDLVIGYSGSGNSKNVINALEYANTLGAQTIGITGNYKGKGGGKITEIANISILINTKSMEIIEDIETIINHIVKQFIKQDISL